MANLSNHFTLEELIKSGTATRKHINNTPTEAIKKNLTTLANNILEKVRLKYGKPIVVSSGYRCPQLNTLVGGSDRSQHVTGNAADIHTVSDTVKDNKELFDLMEGMMKKGEIKVGQLIDEYGYDWIHVSNPGNHVNQVIHIK